jgi:hypothetical protein
VEQGLYANRSPNNLQGHACDDSPRDLWCLIEGDTLIPVSVAANKPIAILKELIYAKGKSSAFGGIDAKDLVLWKVSDILESTSNIYVPFLRLIYLSMNMTMILFGNSKSAKTREGLSTRPVCASPTTGRPNLLMIGSTSL